MASTTRKKFILLLTGLAAIGSVPASANLKLSDFYIDLHDGTKSDSIYASNLGSDVMYVKVSVVEVINPGTPDEVTSNLRDPNELGLLVSPQRLVVQPGGEARIRLVALAEPEKDRFYRITVTPVAGELESNEQVAVKILVAYSAWAYIRPKGAVPDVSARRDGNRLILNNNGGTLAQMMAGKQCNADDSCTAIEPFRVLAGAEKTIELTHASDSVSFRMTWGNQSKDLQF